MVGVEGGAQREHVRPKLYQLDQATLRLSIAFNVPLSRRKVAMPSKFLNVTQTASDLCERTRGHRDHGSTTTVAGAPR